MRRDLEADEAVAAFGRVIDQAQQVRGRLGVADRELFIDSGNGGDRGVIIGAAGDCLFVAGGIGSYAADPVVLAQAPMFATFVEVAAHTIERYPLTGASEITEPDRQEAGQVGTGCVGG